MTENTQPFQLPPFDWSLQNAQRNRRFENDLANDQEGQRTMQWLLYFGPYAITYSGGIHPAVVGHGVISFVDSAKVGYYKWGRLTTKQLEALTRIRTERESILELSEIVKDFYIGKVGERIELMLTMGAQIPCQSFNGSSKYVYKFLDPDKRAVIWYGIKDNELALLDKGSTHKCMVTIVSHRIYIGENQTVVKDLVMAKSRKKRRIG